MKTTDNLQDNIQKTSRESAATVAVPRGTRKPSERKVVIPLTAYVHFADHDSGFFPFFADLLKKQPDMTTSTASALYDYHKRQQKLLFDEGLLK